MATDHAASGNSAPDNAAPGDTAPTPTTPEALMADRQIFWAQFCRTAVWSVVTIGVILVLMAWTLT